MNRIRILLLDDQLLFRESVSRLLADEPDLEIAAECSTREEAGEMITRGEFDVILLGAGIPFTAGAELASASLRNGHDAQFIVMATKMSGDEARGALRAGASGIFLQHTSAAALLRAVRLVAAGDIWLDRKLIDPLTGPLEKTKPSDLREDLTEREGQVLESLMEGLSNGRIAEGLGISEGAVKAALHRIFEKAHVRTRGQLVRLVVEGSMARAEKA